MRLLAEVIKRAPGATKDVGDADLGAAAATVLANWLATMAPRDADLDLALGTSAEYSACEQPHEWLRLDYQCQSTKLVYLELVCRRLDEHVPGLARQLLATLEAVNYTVVDILTPAALRDWATYDLWYGASTDDELREWRSEWNEPEDGNDPLDGVYKPSEYDDSLGDYYRSLQGAPSRRTRGKRRLWSARTTAKHVADTPGWVAAVAQSLPRLRQLHAACKPLHELARGHGFDEPCVRIEPSFVFWWNQTDDMGPVYDDVLNARWERSGEGYSETLVDVSLIDEQSVQEVIEWIEKAMPFIVALEALRNLLWENQNEDEH